MDSVLSPQKMAAIRAIVQSARATDLHEEYGFIEQALEKLREDSDRIVLQATSTLAENKSD